VKADGPDGVIVGYASTFGNIDSYGDSLVAGAFRDTLAAHKAAATMPALLWSHDPSQPIGRWLDMAEDSRGLKATGRLTLQVERAKEAHALARDGALGLSIGFRTVKSDRDKAGHRRLTAVELIETSLVAVPANAQAKILSVRSGLPSADEIRDARAFEALLRDFGFPRALAVAITAKGWAAAVRRGEPEPDAIAAMVRAIEARTATLTKM
jgi:HK97 family phage prohead protease